MSRSVDPLVDILRDFRIGEIAGEPTRFGSGNINEAYLVRTTEGEWILQRVNRDVFRDIACLESNMRAITSHLAASASAGDPGRTLSYVETASGGLLSTIDGQAWRIMRRIPRAHSRASVTTDRAAYEAAAAFGRYDAILSSLAPGALCDTIPGFHDTPARVERLRRTVAAARNAQRIERAAGSIAFCLDRAELVNHRFSSTFSTSAIPAGTSPVCHNDAKLDNLLVDDADESTVCVVDLDTTMNGHPLVDLGDLLRTAAASVSEDERDPALVKLVPSRAAAIVEGFESETRHLFTDAQLGHARQAGWLITMEQAIRFLTDYLEGDAYYRVSYPDHNIDRAVNQCALAASMESLGYG